MKEKDWDKALRVRTAGRSGDVSSRDMPYEPTPYSVLARLTASGFFCSDDYVIDYGSGKGRVAFFLAHELGCRVTGVEKSPRLIAQAEENLRAFPQSSLVRFVCRSAESYHPIEENACFFFNPFSEQVFRAVYGHILQSWFERPTARKLALYYPDDSWTELMHADAYAAFCMSINCADLFALSSPRERIDLWTLPDMT